MNTIDLTGKVAVVTGGAGILGKEFCRVLSIAGARVALLDISEEIVQRAAEEIGPNIRGFACDVSNKLSVESAVKGVIETYGQIDILFNNAASKSANLEEFFKPFEQYEISTWREVMSVNIDGMFLMAQSVGRQMIIQGGGAIIQTSSIYGLLGADKRIYKGSEYLGMEINTPAVYSASKAAVIGLTKWLATYWGENNIRVNCLVPGGVASGQNRLFEENYSARVPMGRMAKANEIASTALFLSSSLSDYITGQVICVDGGLTAW